MNKESGKELNELQQKENPTEKIKITSTFNPISEREQIEPHIQSSITNLQNSECKNFKSGIRIEPANFFL
jgi:hypothetical protein